MFLPVGGAGCLACRGLLVREACVSVLVHGNGYLLSGVPSDEFCNGSMC